MLLRRGEDAAAGVLPPPIARMRGGGADASAQTQRAELHLRQRAVHARRCRLCCTWGSTRSVRRWGRHARAPLPLRLGLSRRRVQRLQQ